MIILPVVFCVVIVVMWLVQVIVVFCTFLVGFQYFLVDFSSFQQFFFKQFLWSLPHKENLFVPVPVMRWQRLEILIIDITEVNLVSLCLSLIPSSILHELSHKVTQYSVLSQTRPGGKLCFQITVLGDDSPQDISPKVEYKFRETIFESEEKTTRAVFIW